MMSRSSYWKISTWDLKRRLPAGAFFLVIYFLLYPFYFYSRLNGNIQMYMDPNSMANAHDEILSFCSNFLREGVDLIPVVTIMCGCIMGMLSFAWLNSQQQVDLYLSLPLKKRVRFLYLTVNSALLFAIPLLLNQVICIGVIANKGYFRSGLLLDLLLGFLLQMLLYLSSFFIFALASILTGNMVMAGFGGLVLLLLEPIIILITSSMQSSFFETYYYSADWSACYGRGILSPVDSAISIYQAFLNGTYTLTGKQWVILIGQAICYFLLAFYAYMRRPAENGGKRLIFAWTKPIIRFCILTEGTLFAGILLHDSFDNELPYMICGMVIGLIVLHMILQLGFEGEFKSVLKGLPVLALSAIVSFGVLIYYVEDFGGYDTYVPENDEVSSFAFVENYVYNVAFYDANGQYVDPQDHYLHNMAITDREAISGLTSLIKQAIDEDFYEYTDVEDADAASFESLVVRYTLQSGKEIYRSYCIREDLVEEYFASIYDLPEYKEVENNLSDEDMENLFTREDFYKNAAFYLGNLTNENYPLADEDYQAIYDSLKEDINDRTYEDVTSSVPIGYIRFTSSQLKDAAASNYYNYIEATVDVAIYESDARTITLLQDKGYYQGYDLHTEAIASMTLVKTSADNMTDQSIIVDLTNPVIQELLTHAISSDMLYYMIDSSGVTDSMYNAQVTTSDGYFATICFAKGSVSQEVDALFGGL